MADRTEQMRRVTADFRARVERFAETLSKSAADRKLPAVSFIGDIANAFEDIGNDVANAADDVGNAVADATQDAVNGVVDVANDAVNVTDDAADDFHVIDQDVQDANEALLDEVDATPEVTEVTVDIAVAAIGGMAEQASADEIYSHGATPPAGANVSQLIAARRQLMQRRTATLRRRIAEVRQRVEAAVDRHRKAKS